MTTSLEFGLFGWVERAFGGTWVLGGGMGKGAGSERGEVRR